MKFEAFSHYVMAAFWVTSVCAGGSCSSLQQIKIQVHEAQKRRDSVLTLKKNYKNNQIVDQQLVTYIATACAGQQAKEVLNIAIDHGDLATVGTLLKHGSSLHWSRHSSKTSTPKQGMSRKNSFQQPPVKQCWQ